MKLMFLLIWFYAVPEQGVRYHHTDLTAAEIKILMSKQEKPMQLEPETMEIPEYVVQPSSEHKKYHAFVHHWGLWSTNLLYDV